ncbi:MAG: U32 family peptidase [Anaerolineae bacterium]|nr:U32 family peptidase [Anaerolineae bacterium]
MNDLQKPEIMSPAGYWPQLHAAIEAGADAIYFGLQHFTARAKVGFELNELPEVMRTMHQRGVRGYLTFNTLVFDHELAEASKTLAAIAEAGTDAIIVQDVGIAKLAKQIAPDLEVHGSTQMSITSAEGVKLAQQFGVRRVVLARELSLDDIRAIRKQTDCELEMFVHGALCVSYSGQCFSSEAWGGRSANRGKCAQACRMPYEMLVDGVPKPLADARYLLSPEDLCTIDYVPEIVKLGVSSLKIEGRYKDAGYVALTTAAYRKAVDEAWANLPSTLTPAEKLQLEQVYSRGLGPHFLRGTNHQSVVSARSPRHRGVLMGQVLRVEVEANGQVGRVIISPNDNHRLSPLKPGDGIVFDAADWRSPQEAEEGGRIYQIEVMRNRQLGLRFGNGAINSARLRAGDWVWRSHDYELDRIAKPFTQASVPVYKQPVWARVIAHEGQPLVLTLGLMQRLETNKSADDLSVTVRADVPLAAATRQPTNEAGVREQLGRLGNTPYVLTQLDLEVRGQPFAPNSLLNELRRQAIDQLAARQGQARPSIIHPALTVLAQAQREGDAQLTSTAPPMPQAHPQLHVLVRTPDQLDAAIAVRPASITLDYLELYGLRPAVEQVQAAGIVARVASPRVLKPNEERVVNFLRKLDCAIVVRSLGLLQSLQNEQADEPMPDLIGDFSLNAANVLTARTFLGLGLSRITPTHDLNAAQIAQLSHEVGGGLLEVIVYQHLPVFHTEHCVFCRFLSTGTSYKDCGHPCEKHRVALRDVSGRAHPVMADVGCRNTVFGAEAQEASAHLDALRTAGVLHYRLEFVHESAEQVTQITKAFRAALAGKLSAHDLARRLRQISPQGTTEGSLFVPDNFLLSNK